MKGICPYCEDIKELELIEKKEVFNVKDEKIEIDVQFFRCQDCGEEFDDPKANDDPIERAYREFRNRKGMLQPENIREIRKSHGLTQGELSRLLGWGAATLSRYENGALQDEAHDTVLKFIQEPQNLYTLVKDKADILSTKKRKKLLTDLSTSMEDYCSRPETMEQRFGTYEPSILSGYRPLRLNNFFQMIKFFTIDGEFKTKLCKLLFYADFLNYKFNSVSISGVKYAHAFHGPVPDKYEHYFATLIHDEKTIRIEEVNFGEYLGENFKSEEPPDLTVFSENEIKVLFFVKNYFKGYSAKQIRDFSHNEKGYKETNCGDTISYAYADDLAIGDINTEGDKLS